MTDLDLLREASYLAFRLRGEPVAYSDLFNIETDEELARLWLLADEWRKTVDMVAGLIGERWVQAWRDRGHQGVEVDGFLVTTKKGYTSEKCVDVDGFHDWLETQPGMTRKIMNPNQVKKGSLPPAARETFFERETVVKPDAVRQPSAIPVEVLKKGETK